jgi:hypothetical protein
MNDVTNYDNDDDGFGGSLNSTGRLLKGMLLKWSDTTHWVDRDGLAPPPTMLVVGVNEAIQRWHDKKPIETITTKPLPDLEILNEAVPKSEWEPDFNGNPKPPYQHEVIVHLVNLATGEIYTFIASSVGAHMAWDHLREAVMTMRALRGARVMPLVRLAERPMKTKFGLRGRPAFEIVNWHTPGDGTPALPTPETPRLSGPASPAPPTSTPPTSAPPTSSPSSASSTPTAKPTKPAAATVAAMGTVEPVTSEELLNDELPW